MDSKEQDNPFVNKFVINEFKTFTIPSDEGNYTCVLLLTGPDSGSIQVITEDLKFKYLSKKETLNIKYLQDNDGLIKASYLRLEEIMEDLASACDKKEIKVAVTDDSLQLQMKIQFNRRIKYINFTLLKEDMKLSDKNEYLIEENKGLRFQIEQAQKYWESLQEQVTEVKKMMKKDEQDLKEQKEVKENPVIKLMQYLKCYQCGDQKKGEMTICINKSSPNRNDEYGKDGYTACCPKESCQKRIEKDQYFSARVDAKETKKEKKKEESDGSIVFKLQYLKCYKCGDQKKDEMTICVNKSDPSRDDEYGKDGFSACCPKKTCQDKIGDKEYFKEKVIDVIKKYQWVKCYQCGDAKEGKMCITINKKSPNRNDEYGKDGYAGCCPKESCTKGLGEKEYFKIYLGTPSGKDAKLDSVIAKYQYFKCYQCGSKDEGKMTICKNTSDPSRNDEYGKDGYTACCTKDSCQNKIGEKEYYKERIGDPSEIGKTKKKIGEEKSGNDQDIVDKFQYLKCYSCGANTKGKMTICKNLKSPDRNDEYGKDGYSACCTKANCLKLIGVEEYFKEKVERDFTFKYQDLKCYKCGDQKKGEMTICNNKSDPSRNDEYGRDGYSACCPKESCLKEIGKAEYFKTKATKKIFEQEEVLEKYQNLKCYKCGQNQKGRMTICINKSDPDTQDEYRKDGYAACCTKEACLKLIGVENYFKFSVQEIVHKFQTYKCYQCGDSKKGKMTVCKNLKSPDRDDGYGKDGFCVCCPKEDCQGRIGKEKQFDSLIGRCIGHEDFQGLQCYSCGDQKKGKMIVCKNRSDPERNDTYGKKGFTVCCPKTSCQSKIGKEEYYSCIYYNPDQGNDDGNTGKQSVLKKFQTLKCYQCGDKKEGKMTICINEDKSRNDEYGKDGFTACCPKDTCQGKIGNETYYKEKLIDIVNKYQNLKCWQCGSSNEGKMSICKNEKEPDRNDEYGKDGYSALCPKEGCQEYLEARDEQKVHLGTPGDLEA